MAVAEAERYSVLFTASIERSIANVLQRTRQLAANRLSDADKALALHVLSFALKLDATWETTRDVLLALAPKMDQAGHWEPWRPFLEQGIERSRIFSDGAAEAELLFFLGVLHQRQARVAEALAIFNASAARCMALGNTEGAVRALNRQAYICVYLQHRPEQARALLEQAGRLEATPYERAYTALVQGFIALAGREWQHAQQSLAQALETWRSSGDQRMVARTLLSLGAPLTMLQRHAEAICCYEEALGIFSQIEDDAAQAITRMNWGITLHVVERYQEAVLHYRAAETIFRRLHDELHLAKLYDNLGRAYRELHQWEMAEASLHLSIAEWHKLEHIHFLVNGLDELGLVYLAQGKREQALAIFTRALAHLDALRHEPRLYDYLLNMVTGHRQQAERYEAGEVIS